MATLGATFGVGSMTKTKAELRGFGVPKSKLNPYTGQLSRWSGRTGIRILRDLGRSVGGKIIGGLTTGA